MTRPPLVSVIIPAYNQAELLRQAIESALAQTYPAVEIIVVDDGSTDGTAALLASYGTRIRAIRQENRGGGAARNTGMRAAHGEHLTFLDHDDLLLPDKIARQVALLAARPDAGAATCRWFSIDRDGWRLERAGVLPEGDVFGQLVLGCFLWSGAPLVRRVWVQRVGGFDERVLGADWDMWLRLAQAGCRFAGVQELLGCYRILPDSGMADVARAEDDIRILDRVFASPALPAGIAALRARAIGGWRLWIACRFYATGRASGGARNLAEALRHQPGLLADRIGLVRRLCAEALDVRVGDPLRFVETVFAHLPAEAAPLRPYRAYAVSRVLCRLALRSYGFGSVDDGQRRLCAALSADPAPRLLAEDFARATFEHTMRLPTSRQSYLATIFQNLPPAARHLERLQARVRADVQIGCAFEDYALGARATAARRILTALPHQPAWLRNRGVVAVLARSLPALLVDGFRADASA